MDAVDTIYNWIEYKGRSFTQTNVMWFEISRVYKTKENNVCFA